MLDLAAGTGKLTRLLAPTGARIVAVEPVGGMRARAGGRGPSGRGPVAGRAESIPLDNASVDGAVVAQAFHWFDAVRALSELHRVIRPGGSLALIWNIRDESVPWVRGLGDLMEAATGGEAPRYQQGWRERLDRCALFEPLDTRTFRHVQRLTVEGVLDRVASVSTVAAAEPSVRERLHRGRPGAPRGRPGDGGPRRRRPALHDAALDAAPGARSSPARPGSSCP